MKEIIRIYFIGLLIHVAAFAFIDSFGHSRGEKPHMLNVHAMAAVWPATDVYVIAYSLGIMAERAKQ